MNTNEIAKGIEQLQIDWVSLPPEANWVAQDSDGQVLWHENKPKVGGDYWGGGGNCGVVSDTVKNWKESLQQRPRVEPRIQVGQIWKNKDGDTYEIVAVNSRQVVRKGRTGFMVIYIEDFLSRLERVG